MNDDSLVDRLHDLTRPAPVPPVDLAADIRRGRRTLRCRRTRATAGASVSLLAVKVTRTDGLVVKVLADGVWGNNMPPGSAPAADMPGLSKLLQLAAGPRLTLPES